MHGDHNGTARFGYLLKVLPGVEEKFVQELAEQVT
jgi:hypothetical protein